MKTFEFQKSDFKALKVLEIDFWSLEVLEFLLIVIEKRYCFKVLKKMKAGGKQSVTFSN